MNKKYSFKAVITAFLFLTAQASFAQKINLDKLPLYSKENLKAKKDWLIEDNAQKSTVYKTAEGHLALSNGLITRSFTINPNGATIGLDNLITNESLLRAVSPEAVIWVNGQEINVGGLVGQPIANYLLPEWIPEMKADPYSLKLESYTTSPIKARFEWNRRTSWAPDQLPWPPKGLEVVFTYKADAAVIKNFQQRNSRDDQRRVLLKDDFSSLSPKWKIVKGSASSSASFINEGKPGEILAYSNETLYGEQALPKGVKVIICKLNTGTDVSTSQELGMALGFADSKIAKFYLSPKNKRFGLYYDGKNSSFSGFDPGKSYFLRVMIDGDKVVYGVSEKGDQYRTLVELPKKQSPTFIRVGKMDSSGGSVAGAKTSVLGRSKIEQVLVLGETPENKDFDFLKGLTVNVHYELYDGLPMLSKWVTVDNHSNQEIIIDNLKTEHLAVTEAESAVEHKNRWELPPLFVESDFAFHSMSPNAAENACIEWQTDPTYKTQVNYALTTPSLLVCKPKWGIGQELAPSEHFESMRIWELLYDSWDRERRGLAERKLYRTIAPWVTENPIIMHVSSSADEAVKKAIDQSAEVGFEMVIMTFGSGFNLEDTSQNNIQRMKGLKEYAASKNIAIGGYSLLASRSINKENNVVMPDANTKPAYGNSPCLQSKWGQNYFKNLYSFYEKTGHDLLEHDGSYPGDVCASTDHPGHRGLEDSQWKQFVEIRDFYRWSRSKGIYLNIPDWYFLNGSSKVAMGYRETNWSLPRAQQEIIERQNIYDGTWEKTPSMGWMFVPLVEYHGGGAAATIEPLKEHLPHYEQRLANLFGAGVQACYRGPQLYDVPETKALVTKWVDFYKKHRRVLDADIIHLRRPDGRDYDGILHADPYGKEKGLLMIYNPLNEPITRTLTVDLYYTGLKDKINISEQDQAFKSMKIDGTKMTLEVVIPAKGQTWFVIKD